MKRSQHASQAHSGLPVAFVPLLLTLLLGGQAWAEAERTWEPDSFGVHLYGSATIRTRISYKVFNESRLEQVSGRVAGLELSSPVLLNHLRMGPDLEVALWRDHLSLFAQATFSMDYFRGFGVSSSHTRMDSALGGLKLGASTRHYHLALGVGVGTANLDSEKFAGSDALVVQPFVSFQLRGGPLSLGGTVVVPYSTALDGQAFRTVSVAYNGRLALNVCRWLVLQAEDLGITLVLDSRLETGSTDGIRTLLDAHGGLRFGSRSFSLGLGAGVPVNHRDQRYSVGLHGDISVVF